MENQSLIIAAAVSFIGLFLIILGVRSIIAKRKLLKFAIKKRGIVIDLEKHRGSKSFTYHPKVEFTDHSGKKIEFSSSLGSSRPENLPEIGDHVDVLYDPETKKIDLARNADLKKLGLIFPMAYILVGLMAISMSLFILFLPPVN